MKAHSCKYVNAAHTSTAVATLALQGLLLYSAKDACNCHLTHTWEGVTEGVSFTVGIEKKALMASCILSSPNHTTPSKTVKAKLEFYSAEMNKLSPSSQKQQFKMYFPFPIPRSTANMEKANNNNYPFHFGYGCLN